MSKPTPPGLTIRPWDHATEAALVYDTWLKSLRHDIRQRNTDMRHVRDRDWYDGQRCVIVRAIVDGGAVFVAELEGIVVGWICASASVAAVHYAYVKEQYRGHGIFRALLAVSGATAGGHDGVLCSHITTPVLQWKRAGLPYEYNPFLAWA